MFERSDHFLVNSSHRWPLAAVYQPPIFRSPTTMYSVLAVDLDDTLLADDKTVSPRTVAALEAWQASGRRIVIATGRPPRSTRIIPSFLHEFPWICYNGAWIELQNNVLFQTVIRLRMPAGSSKRSRRRRPIAGWGSKLPMNCTSTARWSGRARTWSAMCWRISIALRPRS